MDDGFLTAYPARDEAFCRGEFLLVVFLQGTYLLLDVWRFGLLVEITASIFYVANPDFWNLCCVVWLCCLDDAIGVGGMRVGFVGGVSPGDHVHTGY